MRKLDCTLGSLIQAVEWYNLEAGLADHPERCKSAVVHNTG